MAVGLRANFANWPVLLGNGVWTDQGLAGARPSQEVVITELDGVVTRHCIGSEVVAWRVGTGANGLGFSGSLIQSHKNLFWYD